MRLVVVGPFFDNILTPPSTLSHCFFFFLPSSFLSIPPFSHTVPREFCVREKPLTEMLCQH